jgi:hypothetical protein
VAAGVSGTAVGTFGGALNVGANEKLSGNVGPGEKLLTGNVGVAEKLSGNVGPGAKVLTGNVGAAEKLLDMVCITPHTPLALRQSASSDLLWLWRRWRISLAGW